MIATAGIVIEMAAPIDLASANVMRAAFFLSASPYRAMARRLGLARIRNRVKSLMLASFRPLHFSHQLLSRFQQSFGHGNGNEPWPYDSLDRLLGLLQARFELRCLNLQFAHRSPSRGLSAGFRFSRFISSRHSREQ